LGVFIEFESEEAVAAAVSAGTLNYEDDGVQSELKISEKTSMKKKGKKKDENNNKRKFQETPMKAGVLMRITNINDIKKTDESPVEFRTFLRAALSEFGRINHVDCPMEDDYCILRFEEPESVTTTIKALNEDKQLFREKPLIGLKIEGEEETKYWEENILNRESKFDTKKRKFGRNRRNNRNNENNGDANNDNNGDANNDNGEVNNGNINNDNEG